MKTRIILTVTALCLFASAAEAQRRRRASRPASTRPAVVCVGSTIPQGFVAVGVNASTTCPQGAWTLRRPGDTEIVCEGSPVPVGFEVRGIRHCAECPDAESLSNGLLIARVGSPRTAAVTESRRAAPVETPSRAPEGNTAEVVGARAAEVNAAARRDNDTREALAARNVRVRTAIRNREIVFGMTSAEVNQSWGRPESINTSDSSNNRVSREQWVFRRGNHSAYLFFDNGVLMSWSYSR